MWTNRDDAEIVTAIVGGHVVELVEAQAKAVVSEEEAEILKKLDREIRTKSTGYSPWRLSKLDDLGMAVEDACKALTIGWVVEKPKRWNVKVPGRFAGGDRFYCKLQEEFSETAQLLDGDPRFMLTMADIEQLGLTRCERVEVTDDGAKK